MKELIAINQLNHAQRNGGWVFLQNIHLSIDWMSGEFEAQIERIDEGAHPDFRYVRLEVHDGKPYNTFRYQIINIEAYSYAGFSCRLRLPRSQSGLCPFQSCKSA